jgi:hypothetical protein
MYYVIKASRKFSSISFEANFLVAPATKNSILRFCSFLFFSFHFFPFGVTRVALLARANISAGCRLSHVLPRESSQPNQAIFYPQHSVLFNPSSSFTAGALT